MEVTNYISIRKLKKVIWRSKYLVNYTKLQNKERRVNQQEEREDYKNYRI